MPKVVDIQERRAELAAAAAQLIARAGVGAATLRDVAAEAGWTTGALTHYFADKRELLLFTFTIVAGATSHRPRRSRPRPAERRTARRARRRAAPRRRAPPALDGHHRLLRPSRRRRRAVRRPARRLPRVPRASTAELGGPGRHRRRGRRASARRTAHRRRRRDRPAGAVRSGQLARRPPAAPRSTRRSSRCSRPEPPEFTGARLATARPCRDVARTAGRARAHR